MSAHLSQRIAAPAEAAGTASSASQERAAQRRRAWVRECGFIGLSYAINGVFIGLFTLTGTVPWTAGLWYALPGLAATATTAHLISHELSNHFSDPSLSTVHPAVSVLLCLLGMAMFPQMAFAYALILFVTFITATYRTPERLVNLALVGVSLMVGLLTLGLGHKLQIPHETRAEQVISWLFFLVTLGRCVILSVFNADANRLLRQRGLEMAATLAQIELLAHHDELTGVLNRRRLMHLLAEEMARCERSATPLSVALLDLDHFKVVNDTLGHLAGDQVLKQFSTAVQAHMRSTDRFGRYGGEEFLVILPDADPLQAERAIERIREAQQSVDWEAIAPGLHVSFSAGITTYRSGEGAEALLNRADLGLYAAKRGGRNCSRSA